MDSKKIILLQTTFEKIRPITDTVAKSFYDKLFELDPSVKSLFKGDMKKQGRMLMSAINMVVNGLNRPEETIPAIQELGKRHVTYGVKNEHYDTVGEALLSTLEQYLGDDFTSEVNQTWTEAYTLIAQTMKEAAAEVE